jgi:hypothetical protein
VERQFDVFENYQNVKAWEHALDAAKPLLEQTHLRLSFRRFENSRNVEVPPGTTTTRFGLAIDDERG